MDDGGLGSSLTAISQEASGNRLCGAAGCKTCPILTAGDEFTSHTTSLVLNKFCHLLQILKYDLSNNLQEVWPTMWAWLDILYISEQWPLLHITHGIMEESPVAEYFSGEARTLADVTVMAINKIHSHDSCLRKIRESRWIRTLGTSYPTGINLRVDSLWNLHNTHQFLPCGSVVPLFDNKVRRYNQKNILGMIN